MTRDGRPTAGEVLAVHLRDQADELRARAASARADDPDAVHKMRVATRRLRSALVTYRPLLDVTATEPIRAELRWLGTALGALRDAHVQQRRLADLVGALPAGLALGPDCRRLDLELRARHRAARAGLETALDSDRFHRLLDLVDSLAADPPTLPAASRPAERALSPLVRGAGRRVGKRAEAARGAAGPLLRDQRLHDVRKAAKRARYAAEAAAPALGAPADRLAAAMHRLQDVLGEHQDSVTARALLRDIAMSAHPSGEDGGFGLGVMYGEELSRGSAARRDYAVALRKATRASGLL